MTLTDDIRAARDGGCTHAIPCQMVDGRPACLADEPVDPALVAEDARTALDMLDSAAGVAASALGVVRARIGALVAQREAINAEVKVLRLDAERLERMVRAAGHDVAADPNPEETVAP
jgi:hypothetical protein